MTTRTLLRSTAVALALALALGASAPPATAGKAQLNAAMDLRLETSHDGVWGVAVARARYDMPIEGEIHFMANGRLVKAEPISTRTEQIVRVRLAERGSPVTACATFVGATILPDSSRLGAQLQDCAQAAPRLAAPVGRRPPSVAGVFPRLP